MFIYLGSLRVDMKQIYNLHYSDIISSLHSDDNSPLVCWNTSSQDNPKTDNQTSRPDYAYVKCQLNR